MLGGGKLFLPDFPPVLKLPPDRREPVTINPTSNDWRLNRCDRVTEKITVTIPPSGAAPKTDDRGLYEDLPPPLDSDEPS